MVGTKSINLIVDTFYTLWKLKISIFEKIRIKIVGQ